MNNFIGIPGRVLRCLKELHPTAPDDPDRYGQFSIEIDRIPCGDSVVEDGVWRVTMIATWGEPEVLETSVELVFPLARILEGEYVESEDMNVPLW